MQAVFKYIQGRQSADEQSLAMCLLLLQLAASLQDSKLSVVSAMDPTLQPAPPVHCTVVPDFCGIAGVLQAGEFVSISSSRAAGGGLSFGQ